MLSGTTCCSPLNGLLDQDPREDENQRLSGQFSFLRWQELGATIMESSTWSCEMVVRDGISCMLLHGIVEDSSEALPQTKVTVSLRERIAELQQTLAGT